MYTFNIVFRPEPEEGYTVLVPLLPGCLTWAPDIKTGKKLIKEAIKAYLISLKKHSVEKTQAKICDDSETLISSINIHA